MNYLSRATDELLARKLRSSAAVLVEGVGRIARVQMRPMSLWESQESAGQISLKALFDGTQEMGLFENPLSLQDIAYVMCRGGWPGSLSLEKEDALEVAFNLVEELVNVDIH